jgi:hypothetical protein
VNSKEVNHFDIVQGILYFRRALASNKIDGVNEDLSKVCHGHSFQGRQGGY